MIGVISACAGLADQGADKAAVEDDDLRCELGVLLPHMAVLPHQLVCVLSGKDWLAGGRSDASPRHASHLLHLILGRARHPSHAGHSLGRPGSLPCSPQQQGWATRSPSCPGPRAHSAVVTAAPAGRAALHSLSCIDCGASWRRTGQISARECGELPPPSHHSTPPSHHSTPPSTHSTTPSTHSTQPCHQSTPPSTHYTPP